MFGEKHGYATIQEFIMYMDHYAKHPLIYQDVNNTKYPLYVFDSEVLQHHFVGDYDMKCMIV